MNNKNNLGFTFVEMIIAISIVVLLAVIGNSSISTYKEKSNNSKVVSDLATLNNSLTSYITETKDLPKVGGNDNFFKKDTSYSHSWTSTGTFGAHGFITENTLPKKYLNYLPLDPVTNQYYAYGRTKADMQFEIAGVIFGNAEPMSLVNGDYSAEDGPYNLIREYNGPDFVYDKSSNNFPYNPYEKVLTAKINDFSGSVTDIKINDKLMSTGNLLSYNLKKGDKISVSTGSTVDIYFSDGTTSTLGDMTRNSELILSDMSFGGENNLITRIKLALGVGTIWSQATSLGTNSEFNIYTTDSSAAVRGTVFGVNKSTNTKIVVQQGKVKVKKIINNITNIQKLSRDISTNTSIENATLGKINITDGHSIENIHGHNIETSTTNTGIISSATLDNVGKLTNAIKLIIKKYEVRNLNHTPKVKIEIKLNEILKQKAEFLRLQIGHYKYKLHNNWKTRNILTLTGGTLLGGTLLSSILKNKKKETMKLSFCKKGKRVRDGKKVLRCTKTHELKIIESIFSLKDTIKCPKGEKHFAHECVKTKLHDWKLVAYAPYTSNTNLYKKDGTIITSSSSGIQFTGSGIKIPTTPANTNFLAYSGSELSHLGSKFAIELGVRCSDITGPTTKYLFDTDNSNPFLNFTTRFNKLVLGKIKLTNTYFIHTLTGTSILNRNGKCKILTSFNGKQWKINNNSTQLAPNNTILDGLNKLYIGSKKDKTEQWNGIINYVKIYKK